MSHVRLAFCSFWCSGVLVLQCSIWPISSWALSQDDLYEEHLFKKGGPSHIRNNMPLYLFYLAMPPDRAKTLERNQFSLDFDYTVSNTTASAFTPVTEFYKVEIDAEVSRLDACLNYGFYDHLELGLQIPFIWLGRGYLDSFITDFEGTFGFTTPRSRERQGKDNYTYLLRYNNTLLINTTVPTEGLGDTVLTAKYNVVEEEGSLPNFSLRGALKFPTADSDKLLGSGEYDFGLGLLMDKKWGERFSTYFNFDYILIQEPSFLSLLDMDHFLLSTAGGIEVSFTRKCSMIFQVQFHTTPYPNSNTNALDERALDGILGLRYRIKKNFLWHAEVVENESAASPDVSFRTGIDLDF